MRWIATTWTMILAVAALGAATAAPGQAKPSEAELLATAAEQLPFEYRADLQLDILERVAAKRPRWVYPVLERLFDDAASAQYPYKEEDVTQNPFMRSRRLEDAFGLNLDTLSVRLRIVGTLLSLRSAEARKRFASIDLDLPRVPCSSALLPDVSDYYVTLGRVMGEGFSPEEKRKEEHVRVLDNAVSRLSSPLELAAVADLIASVNLPREQLEKQTLAYTQALGRLTATDRELGFLERRSRLTKAIGVLLKRTGGGPLSIALLTAYRDFLVRSAHAGSCADFSPDREQLRAVFAALRDYAEGTVPEISSRELKTDRTFGKAQVEPVPNAADVSRGLFGKLLALRSAPEDSPMKPLYLEGAEADVAELLRRIDRMDTSEGPCSVCLFHEKAEILFALFDMTPQGSMKLRVLDHLVSFMADDRAQQANRIEWLYRFKLLLNLGRVATEKDRARLEELRKRKALLFLPSEAGHEIRQALAEQRSYLFDQYLRFEMAFQPAYVPPPY